MHSKQPNSCRALKTSRRTRSQMGVPGMKLSELERLIFGSFSVFVREDIAEESVLNNGVRSST